MHVIYDSKRSSMTRHGGGCLPWEEAMSTQAHPLCTHSTGRASKAELGVAFAARWLGRQFAL